MAYFYIFLHILSRRLKSAMDYRSSVCVHVEILPHYLLNLYKPKQ